MRTVLNLIGGEERPSASGAVLEVMEPATGAVWGTCPASGAADVEAAVAAARKAFPQWQATPAAERAALLRRLADLVDASLGELAAAESADTGKPIALARNLDVPRASSNLRFFADLVEGWREQRYTMSTPDGGSAQSVVQRPPGGVAACISPWNLPIYLFTWKVAPALAAGCTVVGKPSEVTPVSAWMLGRLATQAGFPPGVLNIIHGRGAEAGAALVSHPDVHAVTFTGGTATGAAIAAAAAPRFRRLSLELGGKNPAIVLDDADLELAVPGALRSAFLNQGQICLCGSRILVQERIAERFTAMLVERVSALRQGDPSLAETEQGAVSSAAHLAKIEAAVARARRDGGRILCGGGRPEGLPARCRHGWFHQPTLIDGLGPQCDANQEEIFGPVATIQVFREEEEAVALANGVRYGLAASVWTGRSARAERVAAQLQAGTVWVNCWLVRDLRVPFGGWKDSGVGREGGEDALRFFTESRTVCTVSR